MSEKPADTGRRDFLKLATTAAPAAAIAVATATTGAEAAEVDAAKGQGLRKTPHVKAYLDSARF